MDVKEFLHEFSEECSKKLNLSCIMQFGSSTYSKKSKDIDIILFSKKKIPSAEDFIELIEIVHSLENKYPEFIFNFGGIGERNKKGGIGVTVIFVGVVEISPKYNSEDIFFFTSLSNDPNIRVLFGKSPLKKKVLKLSREHLFELLSVELRHALRKCLDDSERKSEAMYFLFKTFLRVMLIEYGPLEKNKLLELFSKKYSLRINLPSQSTNIINNKLREGDFQEILKFCENCLNYLIERGV